MKLRMNPGSTKLIRAILFFALAACLAGACKSGKSNLNAGNGNASTANSAVPSGKNIDDIYMARDHNGEPGESSEVFGPADRRIYCVAKLKDPVPATRVKFSWWVVSAKGAENEKIYDMDYTTKEKEEIVHSHLFLQNDWPPGKYKVEVFVNDNLDKIINFAVE